MNEKLISLRLKYENFKKGNEDAFTVRREALAILEEAKENGNEKIINEIEDILIDIQFSIQENKCNCNRTSCC